jgi:hypothetical protein
MSRILGTLLACLAATASGGVREFPVSVRTLANGMKIVVHEDHDIPNVALYLFFRVGSRNERPGITGISHFLEHMMFNGSKKYGTREFDLVMERNGGSNNAYTTRDVTVYSDWSSRSALELVLSMEAERLRNLAFDPAVVESERKVVLSERRTTVENDRDTGRGAETIDAVVAKPIPVDHDARPQSEASRHFHRQAKVVEPEWSGFGHEHHPVSAFHGGDHRATCAGRGIHDHDFHGRFPPPYRTDQMYGGGLSGVQRPLGETDCPH